MFETIKRYWQAKVAVAIFLLYTAWIIGIHLTLPKDHFLYEQFGHSYGVLAVWGGIWGLVISKHWGGFKSLIGRALIMFSLGLFFQEFGQLAYSYYIYVLHVDIPYPSLGDVGFFGTIPFYILGSLFLAKAAGVNVSLNQFFHKMQAILIPVCMLGIGYYLFLRNYAVDLSNPLVVFLDFGYPLGQAIYLSIGILTFSLTRNILGGVMKTKVMFFILAFVAQFLAEYIFVYFQSYYYAASFIDYFYLISYFLMTMAILQLQEVIDRLKPSK